MKTRSNTRISFAKSYPKTWIFLKHVALPLLAGGLAVGVVAATGGTASIPIFAVIAAKIGLGGFYAVLGAAAGLASAWFRNVISDIRKQMATPKAVKEEVKESKLNKESVFQAPPTPQKDLTTTSKLASVFGPAILYPSVGTSRFETVIVKAIDSIDLPNIAEQAKDLKPQLDAVGIKSKLKALAEVVVTRLEQQGEKLMRFMPPEAMDADEFIKKYSDEIDLLTKLKQYRDKFKSEDAYNATIAAYQAFRQFAKSDDVQQLRSQQEVERTMQHEAIAKREQAKADERRAKMGLSLHPLSD